MNNFCTLFDSNFLVYGLALYESLKKHCKDFHLYVFAFDDECFATLVQLQLSNITVISLAEFEDPQLLEIKPSRTRGEYCWTCSSSTILYCLKKYNLSICTYLDADLFFYNDPSILIEEIKDNDVLITEHRYTPKYDQSAKSGVYCVQFMTFRNTENGLRILNWWRDACIEWCYNRFEDGKFGDQKYLDDWTTRFKKVHVLQHLGGGVAPWNIQQYRLIGERKYIDMNRKTPFDMIFFHFHDVKINSNKLNYSILLSYDKTNSDYRQLYYLYFNELNQVVSLYKLATKCFNFSKTKFGLFFIIKQLRKLKSGTFNKSKNLFR